MKILTESNKGSVSVTKIFDTDTGILYEYSVGSQHRLAIYSVNTDKASIVYLNDEAKDFWKILLSNSDNVVLQ